MFGGSSYVSGRIGQQFAEAGGSGRDAKYHVDADLMQLIDAGANMPGYCDDWLAVALSGSRHAGRGFAELGLGVDGAFAGEITPEILRTLVWA